MKNRKIKFTGGYMINAPAGGNRFILHIIHMFDNYTFHKGVTYLYNNKPLDSFIEGEEIIN